MGAEMGVENLLDVWRESYSLLFDWLDRKQRLHLADLARSLGVLHGEHPARFLAGMARLLVSGVSFEDVTAADGGTLLGGKGPPVQVAEQRSAR